MSGIGSWLSARVPEHTWSFVLLSAAAGLVSGLPLGRYLLPLVQAGCFFPVFYLCLTRGRYRRAVGAALLWAGLSASAVAVVAYSHPAYASSRILLAESYRAEMFRWVATGLGPEGNIRQFLPQHALHTILFSTGVIVSGGFLGLVMGAALLNYMSYYVGTLVAASDSLFPVVLLAWPPWAAIRVVAFVQIATGLAGLVYRRVLHRQVPSARMRRLLLWGAGLLMADVLLKWLLAPFWQIWLKAATRL